MLSTREFLKLKDGDRVSFCKKVYVVKGKNDLREPQLVEEESGDVLNGALYGAHLMDILERSDEEPDDVSDPVVVSPEKKKRGRPRKSESPVEQLVREALSAVKVQ